MAKPSLKPKSADVPRPFFRFSGPVLDTEAPQEERAQPPTLCQPLAWEDPGTWPCQGLYAAPLHLYPSPWWKKSMGSRKCVPVETASLFPTSRPLPGRSGAWNALCGQHEPPSRASTVFPRLACPPPPLYHTSLCHLLAKGWWAGHGPGRGMHRASAWRPEAFPGAA